MGGGGRTTSEVVTGGRGGSGRGEGGGGDGGASSCDSGGGGPGGGPGSGDPGGGCVRGAPPSQYIVALRRLYSLRSACCRASNSRSSALRSDEYSRSSASIVMERSPGADRSKLRRNAATAAPTSVHSQSLRRTSQIPAACSPLRGGGAGTMARGACALSCGGVLQIAHRDAVALIWRAWALVWRALGVMRRKPPSTPPRASRSTTTA
eukprot:510347-Prymnesium_polylepis.1